MAITKEQVFAAAETLDQAGERATVQEVRAMVGGGSFTTLSAWLQDWRVQQAAEQLFSQELAAARLRIGELEASRRDLQLRVRVLEIALQTTQQLLEIRSSESEACGSARGAESTWGLAMKSS